jgi:hypothetical protein
VITDIDGKSTIGPDLRPERLEPYWDEYFYYRSNAPELHAITQEELTRELDAERTSREPYIDSQQFISRILTLLGEKHTFHRQFGEQCPDFKAPQILGMQLYELIAADADVWVYMKTQHTGHMFPHSTYFPAGR